MPAEIRVLDIPAEGPCAVVATLDQAAPPPPGTIRWIDLRAQDEASLKILAERFGFHPLALEDCAARRPAAQGRGVRRLPVRGDPGLLVPRARPDELLLARAARLPGRPLPGHRARGRDRAARQGLEAGGGRPGAGAARRRLHLLPARRRARRRQLPHPRHRRRRARGDRGRRARAGPALRPGPHLRAQANAGADAQGALAPARRLGTAVQARRPARLGEDQPLLPRHLRSPARIVESIEATATCSATPSTRICRRAPAHQRDHEAADAPVAPCSCR